MLNHKTIGPTATGQSIAQSQEKALAACVEVVAAAKEVKRLKRLIGDSIGACVDAWHEASKSNDSDESWKPYVLHLETAYAFDIDEETDGERLYLTPEEQLAVLATCPHCLAAHNAIQDRKQARKRLGNARRAITRIGSVKC